MSDKGARNSKFWMDHSEPPLPLQQQPFVVQIALLHSGGSLVTECRFVVWWLWGIAIERIESSRYEFEELDDGITGM